MRTISNDNDPMARNFDIRLLRTFITIVDLGSVTSAAFKLNLTQSAVSQQLRRLETMTQKMLLVRDHLGSRPTSAGEAFLVNARELVNMNDRLWSDVSKSVIGGPVRLGAPEDLIGGILPSILRQMAIKFSAVDISLVPMMSPDVGQALESGLIDIGLLEEFEGVSRYEPLKQESLVWIGATNGVAHARRPLPVSIAAPNCLFRPAVENALSNFYRVWNPVVENVGTEATLTAIRADLAVGVWIHSLIPSGLAPVDDPTLPGLPEVSISLGLPRTRTCSASALALAEELRRGVISVADASSKATFA